MFVKNLNELLTLWAVCFKTSYKNKYVSLNKLALNGSLESKTNQSDYFS